MQDSTADLVIHIACYCFCDGPFSPHPSRLFSSCLFTHAVFIFLCLLYAISVYLFLVLYIRLFICLFVCLCLLLFLCRLGDAVPELSNVCVSYRYKDGRPYPWPGEVSGFILYPESANQTIYSKSVVESDSGNYTCLIRNDTDELWHTINVTVMGKSSFCLH